MTSNIKNADEELKQDQANSEPSNSAGRSAGDLPRLINIEKWTEYHDEDPRHMLMPN